MAWLENRLKPRQDPAEQCTIHRLHEMKIDAGFERANPILGPVVSGNGDEEWSFNLEPFTEAAGQRPAIHPGHRYIQEHDIRTTNSREF
jgi:hypothetical protein